MLKRCQAAGFNLILANVMAHQNISFKSAPFAGRVSATSQFDPLANLTAEAHRLGIKVQAWCCVYYEGAGRSNRPLHPEWVTLSMDGLPFTQNFLSPANPAVNPYLLSVMGGLLDYDIDGIHLDYIRYPGTCFDYSPAGRSACKTALGFDPGDFLDHPERIVPAEEDPFPVRVLHPRIHAEKVWETTMIERTLDQAKVGFGFVSENPEAIARLRAPGILIISSYYDVTPGIVSALSDYVSRGGNLVWADLPGKVLAGSENLRRLTGVTNVQWRGESRIAISRKGESDVAKAFPHEAFRVESLCVPRPQEARVLAWLESGEPALTANNFRKGHVFVPGFHMMKSTSPVVADFARELIGWIRSEAKVNAPDRLGMRRAEWVAWRAAGVAQLVRDLSRQAKARNPVLHLSSSAGPSPWEFYSCYRDGRGWLEAGINDEVFPMNYTADPVVLAEMLDVQQASTPAELRDRVFPGLQIYQVKTVEGKRSSGPAQPAVVEKQLTVVRDHGYKGFCLFAYNTLSDEIIEVVKKFGPGGDQPAVKGETEKTSR